MCESYSIVWCREKDWDKLYSTSFECVDNVVWGYCKQILNTNGKQLMCLSVFDDMLRRESEREREREVYRY